jgi:catechol 2,3-dioxygenase-like lactoylglutathione lyase family enzyme
MSILKIDHVQLAMPAGQEDRARGFYVGLLGIPEVAKPAILASRGGVWFENEGVKVHLGVDVNFVPARKAHPALLVRGLGELVRRLRAAGVEVIDDELLPGYDRVYVADPFGNRLELMETRKRAVSAHDEPSVYVSGTKRPAEEAS